MDLFTPVKLGALQLHNRLVMAPMTRICPDNPFNDIQDEDPQQTFDCLLQDVQALDLAYLHVIRFPKGRVDNIALGQRYMGDRLIGNESYDFDLATLYTPGAEGYSDYPDAAANT